MKRYKHLTIVLGMLLLACSSEEQLTNMDGENEETGVEMTASTKIDEIIGIGLVEPEFEIIDAATMSSGTVTNLFVKVGDEVKQGQIIASLSNEIAKAQLDQLKHKEEGQLEQIIIEKMALKEAQLKLQRQKEVLNSMRRLVASGAEPADELKEQKTELNLLSTQVEKASASLVLSRAQLSEIMAKYQEAEFTLKQKNLVAPFDAIILDIKIAKGTSIQAYDTYAVLAPIGDLVVRAEVDELFSDRLKVGQQVKINSVGYNITLAEGQIVSCSPYLKEKELFSDRPEDQRDRKVREVVISLESSERLIINKKVECIIQI